MPRPSTSPISRTKWAILFSEQGGCCAGCFKPLGEDVHLDHVEPLAGKGKDVFENMQLLHGACNLEKRAMSADAWFRRSWRHFMLATAHARRRQVIVTLDPAVVSQLRAVAQRSRKPFSALLEEGARRLLGISVIASQTTARASVPTTRSPLVYSTQTFDLFDRRV